MGLITKPKKEAAMHKAMGESADLLNQALIQWQENCPGAGWEHHNTRAVVTLAMTPAMGELMRLAAIGKQVEDGGLGELEHVASRIYDSNPQAEQVREAYRTAARAAGVEP